MSRRVPRTISSASDEVTEFALRSAAEKPKAHSKEKFVMKDLRTSCVVTAALALTAAAFGNDASQLMSVDSGSISFESPTNVPGIGVKGTSTSFSGQATVVHDGGALE